MKYFLHLLLVQALVMVTVCTFSQGKSSLDISVGTALPVGNFADKNISGDKSGVAETGEAANISFSHLLGKNLGFSISAFGLRNPIDVHAFEETLSSSPLNSGVFTSNTGFPVPPPGPTVYYKNWKGKKTSWWSGALLAGAYAQIPTSSKFVFTGQLLAGAAYIKSPKIDFKSVSDTSSAYLLQDSKHAIGFAYAVTAGLKYPFSKRLSLLLNADYFATANGTFKDVKSSITVTSGTPGTFNYHISQGQVTSDGRQALSAILLRAGISLQL